MSFVIVNTALLGNRSSSQMYLKFTTPLETHFCREPFSKSI